VAIWFGATWDRAHIIEGQGVRVPSYRGSPPPCQHLLHQSTCPSQGRSHFTIVARFLISSNSLGAIHGSPPCHDTSFAALGLEHGLTIHTSDLILSKAEILRIQASVFKNSAIFNLPPLSTGWPSHSSSTSKS
jgi:hypothetical protein